MRTRTSGGIDAGYMLVEALVYISVVMVLVGIGYTAMYRCIYNSLALRRSAEDISRVLSTGERWRQDVRNASILRWETGTEGEVLLLEGASRTNAWLFSGTNICRRTAGATWAVVLPNVKASSMEPSRQAGPTGNAAVTVKGWTWNVELMPRSKSPRIRPVFTFSAVAAGKLP